MHCIRRIQTPDSNPLLIASQLKQSSWKWLASKLAFSDNTPGECGRIDVWRL
jgi:hypothetical protein